MSAIAVAFLVLAVVIVWGGLVASIWRLRQDARAEVDLDDDVPPAQMERPQP